MKTGHSDIRNILSIFVEFFQSIFLFLEHHKQNGLGIIDTHIIYNNNSLYLWNDWDNTKKSLER